MSKVSHARHVKWDSMQMGSMIWANLYMDDTLGTGETIYSREEKFSRNSLPHEKPMVWKVYEGIKV